MLLLLYYVFCVLFTLSGCWLNAFSSSLQYYCPIFNLYLLCFNCVVKLNNNMCRLTFSDLQQQGILLVGRSGDVFWYWICVCSCCLMHLLPLYSFEFSDSRRFQLILNGPINCVEWVVSPVYMISYCHSTFKVWCTGICFLKCGFLSTPIITGYVRSCSHYNMI